MTSQLEISEAKGKLEELVSRANAGEEIVLSDNGKPLAKLSRIETPSEDRGFGMYKGKVWMSDDFQSPLTDEELKEWGL